MTFSSPNDIIKSTHAIDAKGGRLPIGIPGRLQIGMHGRLRRNPPFGPRIHALAIYLKGFQALSYERLRGLFHDAFGLCVSEGALMNMFIRSHARFKIEAAKAKAILRAAKVVVSDETGVPATNEFVADIEGTNSYHWVFHCRQAVVHLEANALYLPGPDYSRAARVVHEMMAGHEPAVWISDRYSAQQSHGERHQTCLAHLARDTAFAFEQGSDDLPFRFKLWLRIPTKPAMPSNLKPATYSDPKPATIPIPDYVLASAWVFE